MNKLFWKQPRWRKETSFLHILYGLFCAYLLLVWPWLSFFLMAIFFGFEFWNYLIDRVDGDIWESLWDFWEGWVSYGVGIAVIALLRVIGVL